MPFSARGRSRRTGDGDDLAAVEDVQACVELGKAPGGELRAFRKECGEDDRSLFEFHQGNG